MPEHPRSRTAHTATQRWPWVSGATAIVLAVLLGVLVFVRGNAPLLIDQEWMSEVLEHRVVWLENVALVFNFVGGGWFARILVPLVTILVLVLVRRRWSAVYYASAVIASALVVQLLKAVFDRPRPEEMLVASDVGSFPSGHVANAATIVVCLALIFRHAWIWWAGSVYVVAMALSRTYLGAHWMSDTLGGMLIGAGIAVILWAPLASRLIRERSRPISTESARSPL